MSETIYRRSHLHVECIENFIYNGNARDSLTCIKIEVMNECKVLNYFVRNVNSFIMEFTLSKSFVPFLS